MVYYGKALQRNLIFEGNSLTSYLQNSTGDLGHYVAIGTYNAVRATKPCAFSSKALTGRNQTQINASISTAITPLVKKNDVIMLWEGTNDMYTNGLTGAQAYANLMTYVTTVQGYGCKVVVGTVIARDYTLDPGDLMTRIGDYNTLVRNNSANFDGVCDLGADPLFDARADAGNTTYYNADKIHLATAGQDRVIVLMTATLLSIM